MPKPVITVYGAHWCPDCQRSKQFLGEQFIPYRWVDIEQDPEAEQVVLQLNNGKRIIPTLVFSDGSFLAEPSNAELARKLGLNTEPRMSYYDLIIVGGGPSGLTAAIYASREGIRTLVIERSGLGGQAGLTKGIENFPGFPEGISGQAFAERVVQQARRFEAEILQAQEISGLGQDDGYLCACNRDGTHYHAKALLIATGASYRRLGVPGEETYIGAGVHFCATCDGPFYKGSNEIVVVGGGNSACEEGLHLTKYASKVTMLVRGAQLSASRIITDKVLSPHSGITVRFRTVVDAFEGERSRLSAVKIRNLDSGGTEQLRPAAAFVFIGQQPNSDFAADSVERDRYGYILTDRDLSHAGRFPADRAPFSFETSAPGVFAAGDVRHGSTKQVASAVGEGAAAAISVAQLLKSA
jgi:thioredoxin reductase (NADPH)